MQLKKPAIFGVLKIALLIFSLIRAPGSVFAQGGISLRLYPPELENFPKVKLFLDAYDGQGNFIPSMDFNSFKVYEDGTERVVNETRLLEPGLHTIVAYNLGATLSNRQNAVVPTRYEETIFSLVSWLDETESEGVDQYSLTSNEGILVDRLQEKDAFRFQLQSYNPNLFNFQPDFASLSLAMDIAEQPDLVPQSKEAILYITPLPLDQDINQISILRARAMDLGVPVNVWLVAPETAANAPSVAELSQLASSTGGGFYFFSENSGEPDPEDYVGRLRNRYELVYTSDVNQSGTHSVSVEGFYGSQSARTPDLTFSINLNLPTAVLVDLPNEINRQYTNSSEGRVLQPGFVTLTADYLFPDGYDRQLRTTRLYVDGEIVAENSEPPYEFFAWGLGEYAFSGEHLLSVEVEDILGFRSVSTPVSVMITVESIYPTWLTGVMRFLSAGGWIPLTIFALSGTIFTGIQLRRRQLAAAENRESGSSADTYIDPLEQTVPGIQSADEEELPDSRITRAVLESAPRITPKLKWAGGSRAPFDGDSVSIEKGELIVGSDPEEAGFVIPADCISPRHAALIRSESGAVRLADLGSETGTWVNFAPISRKGTILNNGDLVQIGDLVFRYQIGE